MGKAVAGVEEKDGTENLNRQTITPTDKTATRTVVKDAEPKVVKVDPNAVLINVDVKANVPGGIEAFKQKVSQQFNPAYFEGSTEKMTTNDTFIFKKDGTISNIKASGKIQVSIKKLKKLLNL